ncbi:MAG: UDP-glucose 4-epimerase GalE [Intestinibacter sp.]|uniref:UDP-glucose 4-epimerase GalE n=1 Tax=Intestinibacter sp. TaxID=1965304 RepID=UPI0025C58752|nr:UDP-glucose 4-epimerase GalE [Intestinibacter sp.]MCI6738518.1 UDP-glucose 4-epimerase GalE [Intestinibacter sp.]
MNILVTGGAGYIGSHTAVELLNEGYEVIIADNLCNSSSVVIDRIKEITGKQVKFYDIDTRDQEKLRKIFEENKIDAVIHFAALKAVGESVQKPLDYYNNNLVNTITVLELMREFNVDKFVFSSSATVYGSPKSCPIKEDFPLSTTNPYGNTKLMIEDILRDICKVNKDFNVAILRYFNPIGAHESGKIGEEPNGIPNNLMPYITKVAIGQLKELSVFGDDYDTPDGTGVRDYIHVVDLAVGHVRALEKLNQNPGLVTYNLGTGRGYSVLDLVKAFEKASGVKIPYKIVGRRAGDIAMCYADPTKAERELGWVAKYDIDKMCRDSWNWQSKNPNGYKSL